MQKPTTHEDLRNALTGDRYRILEVLAKHDELRSSEIRDYAEIPDGSKHCLGAIDYDLRMQTVYYQPPPTLEEYAHHSAYQELPAEIVTSNLR